MHRITTDERRRRLFAARDRAGVNPFYYTVAGNRLLFASDRDGAFNLYVCDVEEGKFRQLTSGSDPDITPAWSH